jgi:general secretion pathway protein E
VDLRVASVPTQWGEKIVLRILSKDNVIIDLEDLGLVPADYQIILRNIMKPFGMVLITGPTGSGKSTTLYAMLMRIGTERQNIVNISTIEEPVEYSIPRVNQTQVNHQTGVQFSTGLRALLRQDPDAIKKPPRSLSRPPWLDGFSFPRCIPTTPPEAFLACSTSEWSRICCHRP